MSTLKKWVNGSVVQRWRHWLNQYPEMPLLYLCRHNGVTGIVRADDYDEEIWRMRKEFNKMGSWPEKPVRPQVYPIFLFSDKTPGERDFRVGTLHDLATLLKRRAVEERSFELPPLSGSGSTPYGYYGAFEGVGREETRHRKWTLVQALVYLEGDEVHATKYT